MENKPNFTVAKLIDELKKFPPDMPVITNGYEDQYENILPPKTISVKYVPGQPYYYGQFHYANQPDNKAFKALAIEREVRP